MTELRPDYVWYGDDFTGASDTLATLSQGGVKAILLLHTPSAQNLGKLQEMEAIGLAGATRSLKPELIRNALRDVIPFLHRLQPKILHYKICSTFDSSPDTGNIAVALECLRPLAKVAVSPILGGQINLGRYCLFGNLFAQAGQDGQVYRIDRHPTMGAHPVTPMNEADLLLHLQAQGLENLSSLPWTAYRHADYSAANQSQQWQLLAAVEGHLHPLLDIAQDSDTDHAGELLQKLSQHGTVLVAGASSVAQAYLSQRAPIGMTIQTGLKPSEQPVLILVGSQSPVTAMQLANCQQAEIIELDPFELHNCADYGPRLQKTVMQSLEQGHHTLLKTQATNHHLGAKSILPTQVVAHDTAQFLRTLVNGLRHKQLLSRLCIAGGDTSSLSTQALGIWGLSFLGLVSPGVAACLCHSDDEVNGLELVLKGGQMGPVDFFDRVIAGNLR